MNAPLPKLQPGIHRIPMEQYLGDPCVVPALSSSVAHTLISKSPHHAWFDHPRLNPKHEQKERSDFDIGTCAHAVLLERSEEKLAIIDPNDYVGPKGGVPKGWTNNDIKRARDIARLEGKTPILKENAEAVREMVGVCREFVKRSEIAGIFEDGEAELTMIWTEGPTWLKARPDWLTKDQSILLHYKTTGAKAEPESFGRTMLINMGYDMAAAFYERGLYAMDSDGERNAPTSVFLVQESDPPYACSLIGLAPELADLASRKVERAVSLWERCMKSGKWPAYPTRICYIEPKPWQVAEFDEKAFIDPLQQEHGLQI